VFVGVEEPLLEVEERTTFLLPLIAMAHPETNAQIALRRETRHLSVKVDTRAEPRYLDLWIDILDDLDLTGGGTFTEVVENAGLSNLPIMKIIND
jgi:hypothetical protein